MKNYSRLLFASIVFFAVYATSLMQTVKENAASPLPQATHPPKSASTSSIVIGTVRGGANARSCGAASCSVVAVVGAGETVRVLNMDEDWYLVELPSGEEAYILGELLAIEENPTLFATATPSFSTETDREIASTISLSLELVVPETDILEVDVRRSNDDERVIFVSYISTATNETELVTEFVMLFGAVGATIQAFELDLDVVILLINNKNEVEVAIMSAEVEDILSLLNEEITIVDFLDIVSIVPLAE